MGWKASCIIIRPQITIPPKQLLEKLGFTDIIEADPEPFEIAVYSTDGRFFIGNYRNCTILSEEVLTMDLFERNDTPLEQKLVNLFPDAEICAVTLHSSINLWGYLVIKNGKLIRKRLGDADGGTIIDFGEPLEEELELLSQSKLNNNGKRIYHLKTNPSESYHEDQVGENFVFEMFRRYTGESLDRHDDLLFNTSFEGFNVTWPKINLNPQTTEPKSPIEVPKKNRWK